MTIFVDDFRHPVRRRGARRASDRWSHLVTDSPDLHELHEFARQLGLRTHAFQTGQGHAPRPHYDVSEPLRAAALQLGAVPISWRDTPEVLRRATLAAKAGPIDPAFASYPKCYPHEVWHGVPTWVLGVDAEDAQLLAAGHGEQSHAALDSAIAEYGREHTRVHPGQLLRVAERRVVHAVFQTECGCDAAVHEREHDDGCGSHDDGGCQQAGVLPPCARSDGDERVDWLLNLCGADVDGALPVLIVDVAS